MDKSDQTHRLDYFYEQLASAIKLEFQREFKDQQIDQRAFGTAYGMSLIAKAIQGLMDAIAKGENHHEDF